MINSETNRIQVERAIISLEHDFRSNKGLILTEDDLKCYLFEKLMAIPSFSLPMDMHEPGMTGLPIHAELSWFDENDKLTIRPDISIIDPKNLRILRGRYNCILPSKEYLVTGADSIIIELKYYRNKQGIISRHVNKGIKNDINKIERLFDKLDQQGIGDDAFAFIVIFSKVDRRVGSFDDLMQRYNNNRLKIIYGSGDV